MKLRAILYYDIDWFHRCLCTTDRGGVVWGTSVPQGSCVDPRIVIPLTWCTTVATQLHNCGANSWQKTNEVKRIAPVSLPYRFRIASVSRRIFTVAVLLRWRPARPCVDDLIAAPIRANSPVPRHLSRRQLYELMPDHARGTIPQAQISPGPRPASTL